VAGAVGEWSYYVVGSAVEVALLVGIAAYAWSWPKRSPSTVADVQESESYVIPNATP
jgi:hypothetical protein